MMTPPRALTSSPAQHHYRSDIDGLRALAILPVLAFHAFPEYVKGGFVGVDIFFVISGFLITGIIHREFLENRFSIKNFYFRRIRRIFPALLLVIACVLSFALIAFYPQELKQLAKHSIAGIAFLSNWAFFRETGYFNPAAESKPFLHLWSLGVEEQFYIVWPVLLFFGLQIRRPLAGSILFFFLSLLLCIVITRYNRDAAFFLPFTRFWELLAGSMLALLGPTHRYTSLKNPACHWASFFGLALILFAIIFYNANDAFPGWLAILPVLGATLIIASPNGWLNRHILSSRIMVGIGLISYPLYLWHWPIISILHITTPDPTMSSLGLGLALAFCLAAATYYFLERPLRGKPPKDVVPALSLLAIALIGFSWACYAGLVSARTDYPALKKIEASANDWAYPPQAWEDVYVEGRLAGYRLRGESAEEVVYLGDSNMQQYAPRIEQIISSQPGTRTAVFLTMNGCRPLPGLAEKSNRECLSLYPAFQKYRESNPVKKVVIGGRWHPGLFEDDMGHWSENGFALMNTATGQERAAEEMENFIKQMQKENIDVVLIQNIPSEASGMAFPLLSRWKLLFEGENYLSSGVLEQPFKIRDAIDERGRQFINGIAQRSQIEIIDPLTRLCGNEICPVSEDGVRVYMDSGHLTASFAREKASYIDATLLNTSKGR